MKVPQNIVQKMRNLQIVGNETRFSILIALYNAFIFKYGNSQSFTELKDVIKVSNSDLDYHLKLLLKNKLIIQKRGNYNISTEGIRIMKIIGLKENKIKSIGKKIGIN